MCKVVDVAKLFSSLIISIVFIALTKIDHLSNVLEIIRIDSKLAAQMAQNFPDAWLSRYHGQLESFTTTDPELNDGTELKRKFLQYLGQPGIKSVPTTAKNP